MVKEGTLSAFCSHFQYDTLDIKGSNGVLFFLQSWVLYGTFPFPVHERVLTHSVG